MLCNMIRRGNNKVPSTYDVFVVIFVSTALILGCCDVPISNGFTIPNTKTTSRVSQPRQLLNCINKLPSSSLSSSSPLLTVLYGSKNTILPKSRLLSNNNPTFKKRKTKKTNPVSEFSVDTKDGDEYDDNEDNDEDEFIEFAMEDTVDSDDDDEMDDVPELPTLSAVPIPTLTEEDVVESSPLSLSSPSNSIIHDDNNSNSRKVKVQYCALEPGTVIQMEVGDISRARKAWKKRRRSDSPLLIPCSILNVNRRSSIRYNCIYLLKKFGTSMTSATMPTSTKSSSNNNSNSNTNGISISLTELSTRYRTHLKSSLLQHALQLGYSSSYELITNIFHPSVQEAYGVQLVPAATTTTTDHQALTKITDPEGNNSQPPQQQLFLQTSLSRTRAHSRAANAAILQFTDNDETTDALDHTGLVRIKKQQPRPAQPQEVQVELTLEEEIRKMEAAAQANVEVNKNTNLYSLVPLSVALRVSSEDVLENLVYTGSRHAAVVFDYDVTGDANVLPLITLSLNPQRNQVRDRYKQKNSNISKPLRRSNNKKESSSSSMATTKWLHDLKVGDGPYTGKIVRLVKGGAIIDCDVYRHRRKQQQPTTRGEDASPGVDTNNERNSKDGIPVFGVLRFKDAVLSETSTTTSFEGDEISNATDDDDEEKEEDDSDWNDIFSIDELNNFDDDDEEEEVDDLIDEDDDDLEELSADADDDDDDDGDGEILAAFNLENDDEFAEGEDITHLFNIKDDGTLEYTDPETGITQIISDVNIKDDHDHDDEEEEDHDDMVVEQTDLDDEDEDDGPVLLSSFETTGGRIRKPYTDISIPKYRTQTLRVGDTVDIYMKSISKQSNQLFLSMDASIQGKKAKDMKKDSDVSKKINRLIKQLGGYQRLRELTGTICHGTIKAISNTGGDWYYVQPDLVNIPVGIATTATAVPVLGKNNDDDTNTLTWNVGDIVQIQLNGIDPDRGQLAMNIIGNADNV